MQTNFFVYESVTLNYAMSTVQKILKFLLPQSWFQKIEEESKKWFIECNKCGYSKSVWEAGGIRAFATSKGKRIFGYCPKCKKYKFFKLTKKKEN